MRMPVMEDRDSIFTRMKYSLESAAHAQERFDRCKQDWRKPGEECRFLQKEIHPFRHGSYYVVQIYTGMCPMPPPVWFAKKNLRQDQIAYLEDVIKAENEQKNK